jgi:glycosyltransferase involved in cell wall biosynthesis
MATGGAQRVLLDQARWFHSHGHHVVAAFFYDKENLCLQWQQANSFPIHDLRSYESGANTLRQALNIVRGVGRLWCLLRQGHFDVIEAFTQDSNMLGLPVAWLVGVPVRLATCHGQIERNSVLSTRVHTWLVNVGVASHLIAVSKRVGLQALEEGIEADNISVIPNGISPVKVNAEGVSALRDEFGLADGMPFLLSIGRLIASKGHKYLIEAMPMVLEQFPDALLCIAGDGPVRGELEAQITRLELKRNVNILGTRGDVSELLALADVFILPSVSEGLPIALLEAMATGVAVVSTRFEGVDEIIEDGQHGILVPLEDVNGLGQALLQLLNDHKLRDRLGKMAQLHVRQNYTTEAMCARYSRLIALYLERGSARHNPN